MRRCSVRNPTLQAVEECLRFPYAEVKEKYDRRGHRQFSNSCPSCYSVAHYDVLLLNSFCNEPMASFLWSTSYTVEFQREILA